MKRCTFRKSRSRLGETKAISDGGGGISSIFKRKKNQVTKKHSDRGDYWSLVYFPVAITFFLLSSPWKNEDNSETEIRNAVLSAFIAGGEGWM